ncbi:hypothetical protein ORD22_07845 [Sporosarcina sp. GW1-11]|uniref:DUF7225 domain-containing protein n=1 Tax=Sporosarcina sp. GW1-11 TaxID=2899126 RepID=UPI00294DA7B9|nr:hypothetical protein [Sporosarcina sp. GW1-11]MDV6378160.1 hypothetical protein [Sporosarcina sp. GW1-11]
MKIYDQMKQLLARREGEIITSREIRQELQKTYGTKPSSVLPSDFCYNRYNSGIAFDKHLFEYLTKSTYKYLGERAKYSGLIFHKPKGAQQERVVGEWKEGVKTMYAVNSQGVDCISQEQIKRLYEEYIRVLRYELQVLQCQPTELRHLIGRIGELLCAMVTGGHLARETNQHGFDVVSQGRKISVKTSAQQLSGFISFNRNTFETFDDVFIVQYREDDFHIIYYGSKDLIKKIARTYKNIYEVDIEKVKKLSI